MYGAPVNSQNARNKGNSNGSGQGGFNNGGQSGFINGGQSGFENSNGGQGNFKNSRGGKSGNNNRNNRNNFNKEIERKINEYAVYPKNDSEELIELINSKVAQDNDFVQKSPIQDPSIIYLKIQAPNTIERKLLDLTGTKLLGDSAYYFSSVPRDEEEKISAQIYQKFNTELLEDKRLNLSNLSEKLGIRPLQRYSTSFILFLCAVLAFQERIEISEILFENNSQRDTKGFSNVIQLYPFLERVYFAGNPLGNDKNLLRPFTQPRDSDLADVQLITREFAAPTVTKSGWGVAAPKQVSTPYELNIRPIIKGNYIHSKRPKFVLGNFVPASINPNDSPIHRFILAFVDRGWSDLKNIDEFYNEDSVFSFTSDMCIPNSPLYENYTKDGLSRNFLDYHEEGYIGGQKIDEFDLVTPGKIFVGAQEIAEIQSIIFGDGFYATLNSFDMNFISEEMCAVICHGAFHKTSDSSENVFCFDRSFFIDCSDEDRMSITNDHIFIRIAKLPGMM